MPHTERRNLCRILDQNNRWEELAGTHMKYDVLTMQELRREIFRCNSPTEELLTMWGNQNHTVLELFILLGRIKHYRAMSEIKQLVDKKYHELIPEGDENLKDLLADLAVADEKIQNNCLHLTPKVPSKKEVQIQVNCCPISREDNNGYVALDRKVSSIPKPPKSPLIPERASSIQATDLSLGDSAGAIPMIPYAILQQATSNWSPTTILGKGGFGTVFKGKWKCTEVAIKRIETKADSPESHIEQIKQSITERNCLNAYRHDNVLPLYGYSVGGPQPCLVYQYMSGGCLERKLRIQDPTKALKWPMRMNIAIGTARGLQFLHTIGDKPLIHGDIKSANILLDINNSPRIGDFGLAKEGPRSDYSHITLSRIHGTKPYLPDEFLRARQFSTKLDTYSFGVVLFELATGLGAYSTTREISKRYLYEHVLNYPEERLHELLDNRANTGIYHYHFPSTLANSPTHFPPSSINHKPAAMLQPPPQQMLPATIPTPLVQVGVGTATATPVLLPQSAAVLLPPPVTNVDLRHFGALISIGTACVQKKAKDRPEMVQVLVELERCV